MKESPSVDQWLKEAKADESAPRCGMYLTHNGTVRELPKKLVRQGIDDGTKVVGMNFSYDEAGVEAARQEALQMPGIEYVRVWLNEGSLQVGDRFHKDDVSASEPAGVSKMILDPYYPNLTITSMEQGQVMARDAFGGIHCFPAERRVWRIPEILSEIS